MATGKFHVKRDFLKIKLFYYFKSSINNRGDNSEEIDILIMFLTQVFIEWQSNEKIKKLCQLTFFPKVHM